MGKKKRKKPSRVSWLKLLINLEADSAEIKGHIEANLNNVEVARMAVTSFRENNISPNKALDVLSVMVTYNDISLQDASYQSIVGSGSLGLIGNIELRMDLIEYYQFMEQIRSVETVHNQYITSYVLPFVMKNMDMTGGRLTENFDLNSIEFRNLTAGYYVIENQKMEVSHTLDSLNTRLKKRLTTQLNIN